MSDNNNISVWHVIKGVLILVLSVFAIVDLAVNESVPSGTDLFLAAGILYLMWDR